MEVTSLELCKNEWHSSGKKRLSREHYPWGALMNKGRNEDENDHDEEPNMRGVKFLKESEDYEVKHYSCNEETNRPIINDYLTSDDDDNPFAQRH